MEEFEIDLDELFDNLTDNVKEDVKDFSDIVNLDGSLRREIFLFDIGVGTGSTVDGMIRFWNSYDDDHNIPVEERKPIKIFIDSSGGSLGDTLTMIDSIEMSKTPVWTIVVGSAYSGGFFTAIAGHKRMAYPHASFMMHEGATQTGGDAHKFRNYADFYSKELEQLKSHVLKYTSLTEEEYESVKRDDYWLTSEEALEKGVIDEISKGFV